MREEVDFRDAPVFLVVIIIIKVMITIIIVIILRMIIIMMIINNIIITMSIIMSLQKMYSPIEAWSPDETQRHLGRPSQVVMRVHQTTKQ